MQIKNLLRVLFLLIFSTSSFFGQTADYQQIIFYGQSLSLGWQAPRAITTSALDNNYMLGSHVNTLYTNNGTSLSPLKSIKTGPVGEQPIVSCINSFSEAYRNQFNSNQKFIGFAGGYGGQTIEKLSKESTNDVNYYNTTFLQYLDHTLTAINNQTVNCPAIVYMQGEHNSASGRAENQGLTAGSNATLDKTVYKDLLLKLKNNMQSDIMDKYHQTEKPLFFIYQTSGGYITLKEMPVVMAQIEFAEENDDVILLNPHYAMPDYSNGHMSTNGYRWYGELISKSLVTQIINGNTAKTLKPSNFSIEGKKIMIDYEVPSPPLVLDTWTTPKQSNYGFEVYRNGAVVDVNTVSVVNNNQIEINCDIELTGKIEIVYAGNTTYGSGNVRDSDDSTTSMYTYYNDSGDSLKESYTPTLENGSSIYNQNYGLQNWSNMFYYDLTPSVEINIGETFVDGDFEYKVTGVLPNEVEVSGFAGTPIKSVIIPETVSDANDAKSYTVTAIGLGAFSGNTNASKGDGDTANAIIETVVLPTTVTSIGDHAFRDTNLVTINLNLVNAVGSNCFAACSKLENIGSLLNLDTLGRYAFYACKSLTSFVLPNTVTIYEDGVVYDLDGITSFNIPSTVTQIGTLFLGRNDHITEIQANWLNPNEISISADNFFRDLYEPAGVIKNTITLYVPKGTKSLYENHALWGLFPNDNIVEGDKLSINNLENELGLTFYPNPTTDYLNIELNKNVLHELDLYNAAGQKVQSKKIIKNNKFDLRKLPIGIYMLKIYSDNKVFTKKIVKI